MVNIVSLKHKIILPLHCISTELRVPENCVHRGHGASFQLHTQLKIFRSLSFHHIIRNTGLNSTQMWRKRCVNVQFRVQELDSILQVV